MIRVHVPAQIRGFRKAIHKYAAQFCLIQWHTDFAIRAKSLSPEQKLRNKASEIQRLQLSFS